MIDSFCHLNTRLQSQSVRKPADSPASRRRRTPPRGPRRIAATALSSIAVRSLTPPLRRVVTCSTRPRNKIPKPSSSAAACPRSRRTNLTAVGENVHVVKDRCDLAATLRRLVRTESTTPDSNCPRHPEAEPIRPENDAKVKPKNDLGLSPELPSLTSFQGQTRAFLKVQDGCDCFCSYCIIPTARPVVRFKKSRRNPSPRQPPSSPPATRKSS